MSATSQSGCASLGFDVPDGTGLEGGVAFFRILGAGDVVALTEAGDSIGSSGAEVSLRRTRTGFPLDACLRVSNRSGYALTNVNKSLCPYSTGLKRALDCLSTVPILESRCAGYISYPPRKLRVSLFNFLVF